MAGDSTQSRERAELPAVRAETATASNPGFAAARPPVFDTPFPLAPESLFTTRGPDAPGAAPLPQPTASPAPISGVPPLPDFKDPDYKNGNGNGHAHAPAAMPASPPPVIAKEAPLPIPAFPGEKTMFSSPLPAAPAPVEKRAAPGTPLWPGLDLDESAVDEEEAPASVSPEKPAEPPQTPAPVPTTRTRRAPRAWPKLALACVLLLSAGWVFWQKRQHGGNIPWPLGTASNPVVATAPPVVKPAPAPAPVATPAPVPVATPKPVEPPHPPVVASVSPPAPKPAPAPVSSPKPIEQTPPPVVASTAPPAPKPVPAPTPAPTPKPVEKAPSPVVAIAPTPPPAPVVSKPQSPPLEVTRPAEPAPKPVIPATSATGPSLGDAAVILMKGFEAAQTNEQRLELIADSRQQRLALEGYFQAHKEPLAFGTPEVSSGSVLLQPGGQETKLVRMVTKLCPEGALLYFHIENGKPLLDWPLFAQCQEHSYDQFAATDKPHDPRPWFTVLCRRTHASALRGVDKDKWISLDAQGSLAASGAAVVYVYKDTPAGHYLETNLNWDRVCLTDLQLGKRLVEGQSINVVLDCAGTKEDKVGRVRKK